jgi:hypothetical protein
MKSVVAKVLAVTLLLSVPVATSWSATAPKPGAACKPAGTVKIVKSQKFTCIKSGKKLVWSKPQKVTKPATAAPTPAVPQTFAQRLGLKPITPWASTVNGTQLSDAAQLKFIEWIETQSNSPTAHQFIVLGNPLETSLEAISEGDKLISRLFSQFIPGGSVTVVGTNGQAVLDKARELGFSLRPEAAGGCLQKTWSFNYCLNNQNFVGYTVEGSYLINLNNPGMAGIPAHEYFHNVQSSLAGTPGEVKNSYYGAPQGVRFPVWFTEGTAEFVGYAVLAHHRERSYSGFRDAMMSRPTPLDPDRNALQDYTYRVGEGNGSVIYPYNVGRMAAEYLIASKGFESVLAVFQDFKVTQNFEKSFLAVYGLTVQDFYLKFESIRTQIGLPPVSMVLVGESNVPKP